jgi:serine protease
MPRLRTQLAALAALAMLALACQTSGPESDATAVPADDTVGWTTSGTRTPLGAAGKPILETATGPVIADEMLVKFRLDATLADRQTAVARAGGALIWPGDRTGFAVVRFADTDAMSEGAVVLMQDAAVSEIALNHVMTGTGVSTSPTFELGIQQWNIYAMELDVFDYEYEAPGVTIAVLDTGVAYEDHQDALGTYLAAPDLVGVDFAPGYDFINDDAHPNDDQRHGTHVTGVIAAERGIGSLAINATILPVKVLDGGNSGTELALAEGIMFAADHDADVINMSLSFPPTYFPSRMLQKAVDHAAKKGVIMVAAAGNHDEGLVAYPAAFRDVIAVGASALDPDFEVGDCDDDWHGWGGCDDDPEEQWEDTIDELVRAPYSNRGWKLDVLAPGGTTDGDANGDGHPEGVLAQTFALGDPTDFDYYFYAGTSQAAAEVSALAAVMLHDNPDLDPRDVRALLVENADAMTWHHGLDLETGRGAVDAKRTVKASRRSHAEDDRARYFANVMVTLHDEPEGVVARASVEVLKENGKPAKHIAAFDTVVGKTNHKGVATFESAPLEGNMVVAFQVDAVSKGRGRHATFDRPLGFLRIDSLSLEMLSVFGQGVSTSPTGVSTSPTGSAGGEPWGQGVSTSPTVPLPTDPAQTPISIAFDPALFAGTNYRETLLLPNFSWGMATSPMAVAVDASWFLATFPGAADRRVLSYGKGIGSSALYFDGTSFPIVVVVPNPTAPRLPLIVLTFTSGVSTSPTGSGVSTSPTGVSTSPTIIVDVTYGGLDVMLAQDLQLLYDRWHASAAGVSTSPTIDDPETPDSIDQVTFDEVATSATSYFVFSADDVSSPMASYGDALAVAAMPMAPVPPESDGEGDGVVAY